MNKNEQKILLKDIHTFHVRHIFLKTKLRCLESNYRASISESRGSLRDDWVDRPVRVHTTTRHASSSAIRLTPNRFQLAQLATVADVTPASRSHRARPHPLNDLRGAVVAPRLLSLLVASTQLLVRFFPSGATMQNDKKEVVDLYIPRKWYVPRCWPALSSLSGRCSISSTSVVHPPNWCLSAMCLLGWSVAVALCCGCHRFGVLSVCSAAAACCMRPGSSSAFFRCLLLTSISLPHLVLRCSWSNSALASIR